MLKRILLGALVLGVLGATLAVSRSQLPPTPVKDLVVAVESRNPWTHLKLNNDPDEFRFAIISDRTGGHRGRVFSQAVEQINLLQPEFVLSVGDLIEGYTEKQPVIDSQWKEFQGFVSRLQMPFFYVPGNHDVTNKVMLETWREKFGREYYHFVYRNVLFLALNTNDPVDKSNIGEEQLNWLKQTLEQNAGVRWTVVCVHKPLWDYSGLDPEKVGWNAVEKLLNGRKYTVFAGHMHNFKKWTRQGMSYFQLATTGGGSKMRGVEYGEFDQIAWVTMKKAGPVIANVLLDGVYAEDMRKPAPGDEPGVADNNRRPTFPVTGKVLLDGCPLAGARVVFVYLEPGTNRKVEAGDATIAGDGSFTLSTFKANDGGPVGDYIVCVRPTYVYSPEPARPPAFDIPEKYLKVDTSPLKATVTRGENNFVFELKP